MTVKEMFRDSVYVYTTLNDKTTYSAQDEKELKYVLSLRILYMYVFSLFFSKSLNRYLPSHRYFVDRSKLLFTEFRNMCRCSLENALNIIREASKKTHVCIAVDEFTRISAKSSGNVGEESPLQTLIADITPLLDRPPGGRLNVVFSSLAHIPLQALLSFNGRVYEVIV